MTDEIEIDEEFLKIIVFWCLENLSWKLEICCNYEYESENDNFKEITDSDCCL